MGFGLVQPVIKEYCYHHSSSLREYNWTEKWNKQDIFFWEAYLSTNECWLAGVSLA